MTLLLLLAGLVALVAGAELLVRGASRLALAVGISPLVIGLTIVAYGTSTPELAVAMRATTAGQPDIVMGNAVGSTQFNVLFILGLSAVLRPLRVAAHLVWLEVPVLIGAALLLLGLSLDGVISRWDGLVLLVGYVAYAVFVIRKSRQESAAVKLEYEQEFGAPSRGRQIGVSVGLTVAGLALCVLGARWCVDGAVQLARAFGLSELVIGLTVVAAGTSLPEVVTSLVATVHGRRDIAIGNVIGASIYNALAIVGLSGLVAPDGLAVARSVVTFDLPVMVAVGVACLPIFFSGHKIARWEGAVFLGSYAAYTGYLVLAAQRHDALPVFSTVMLWFVIPLTAVTIAIVTYRAMKVQSPEAGT
jgi:cation:H+ antiporter